MLWLLINRVILIIEGIIYCHEYDRIEKVGDIMDQYVIALILGVIEGITECIPVSSTGHMIIIGHMLNFEGAHADVFEVFSQIGAIG